jgi:regulator of cell morphogenesis and NO signaling
MQTKPPLIDTNSKVAELIFAYPSLIIMLEHFEVECNVGDMTVSEVCSQAALSPHVFVTFGNLFIGKGATTKHVFKAQEIAVILRYLRNCHKYYRNEKYPEILQYIQSIREANNTPEIKLLETFFNQYFSEVAQHLDYEEAVAFPYFETLINEPINAELSFSATQYHNHHTDIEEKLADLKNLLIKHVHVGNQQGLRRKLLASLFELEFDLRIHSLIEEKMLVPSIAKIEKGSPYAE